MFESDRMLSPVILNIYEHLMHVRNRFPMKLLWREVSLRQHRHRIAHCIFLSGDEVIGYLYRVGDLKHAGIEVSQ